MRRSTWLALLLALPLAAGASPGHDAAGRTRKTSTTHTSPAPQVHRSKVHAPAVHRAHESKRAPNVQRDERGRIKRDPAQKAAFRRSHPCPSTNKIHGACPGWEVDHRKPLACGGSDSPGNMQWLTTKENRAKGAHECGR